jgi:carbon starvation protein
MSAILIVLIGLVLFVIAYITYGAFLSKKFGINVKEKTPAHTMNDGVDYVPAKSPILLGHHFASIAGAGPILGPVIASVFGWVPVLLWIVIGGIFFGGVHDMGSMIASVRHQGRSIGQIIEDYLGHKGKILFLIFAYLTMILVIAVFAKIVATTFVTVPAVATSSFLFILVALIFGVAIYRTKLPLLPSSLIGVVLLFLAINLGTRFPLVLYPQFTAETTQTLIDEQVEQGTLTDTSNPAQVVSALETAGETRAAEDVDAAADKTNVLWVFVLLAYVFIAATTPVWILLQPRDYLNSFLLYALLIGGVIGLFFASPKILLPEVTTFETNLGLLFPVLFVTVACGAISGFHSMVASGTTAKQVNREPDVKLIGYGGMLIESVLAIIALLAAATIAREKFDALYSAGDFIAVFSEGVGWFMSKIPLIGISKHAAITFSGLAVSAFALTTLDTCTRLARFAFQEFFIKRERETQSVLATNRFVGTAVTVVVSALFIFSGSSSAIWPVFGSANQLLAALALLAVTVWLSHLKKPNWYTKIPMAFMYLVTLSALFTLIVQNIQKGNIPLALVGLFLAVVAVLLGIQGIKKLHAGRTAG